jgi:hypothetical protein
MTDESPERRSNQIALVLAELERVWRRNPHKRLTEIVERASKHHVRFCPTDATDHELFIGLVAIGPGLPAPVTPAASGPQA